MPIKVHQLAKKLKVTSKAILAELKNINVKVKSHMSVIDDDVAKILSYELKRDAKKPASKKKTAAKKKIADKKKAGPKKKVLPKKKPESKKKVEPKKKPEPKEGIKIAPLTVEASKEVKPEKTLEARLPISVKDLSTQLKISASELIGKLITLNIFATINQFLDEETTKKILSEYGYVYKAPPGLEDEIAKEHREMDKENLTFRAPVVTFMGHVDHGKTSLLDYIRKTKVAEKEAGQITQHIGAYHVDLPKGQVTFLDTPGHEAFTAMRARGANVTDVVVLVVAADDGIMPQTIEAIDHARAAGVTIVVAINKIDKPGADVDRVKQELQKHDLAPEEWGGKTICVGVSAKTGEGIDDLLEMLLLESEILELKANADKPASGVVIEAHLSKGRGPVATLLVQNGTLRKQDVIITGKYYGRVKAMLDDCLRPISEVKPAMPAEISGLNGVPQAGDKFYAVKDEKVAKDLTTKKMEETRLDGKVNIAQASLEDLYGQIKAGKLTELKVILKADSQGSVGALSDSLEKLSTDEVKLKIIHSAVGNINDSDVMLAVASNAVVIGFHVSETIGAKERARNEKVDVRLYRIIYEAVEDVEAAMEGLLEPVIEETVVGYAEVRQVFRISKGPVVAGCYVTKGKIHRALKCRLRRDKEIIHKGKIHSLKRFKDDAREVLEKFECGIGIDGMKDVLAGDIIECFEERKVARKLK